MISMKTLPSVIIISLMLLMCCSAVSVQSTDTNLTAPKIDLVFVIDTTGSMSDEIREVKMHIRNVIEEVISGTPKPDVSIGFVIYRDYPDQESEYVYKIYAMTSDIDTVMENLEEFIAAGGGDYEEVVTVGLDVAINDLNWRVTDANGTEGEIIDYDENQNPIYSSSGPITKMIFLIGDAAPRTMEYPGAQDTVRNLPTYKENIEDAKTKDISIYTISCSGMNDDGEEIWQQIALETNGKYEQLTYERKNIQVYIEEEELDEHWGDDVKGMSDYHVSDGTILTNSLGDFVRSAVMDEAKSLGVRYDNETNLSNNVVYVADKGYLFDADNDTVFDAFHCNETGKNTTIAMENGTYLINVDDDGAWEYTYNNAEGVVPYQDKIGGIDLFVVVFIVIVGVVIGIAVFLKRK